MTYSALKMETGDWHAGQQVKADKPWQPEFNP